MRKTLTLLLILACASSCSAFSAVPQTPTNVTVQNSKNVMVNRPNREEMQKRFEQRLNLTDKQKEQAKKLNEKGRAKMEPVMKEIHSKHKELMGLKTSELTDEEKTKKAEQLKTELKELDKKARDLRKKNSEEFEKILNKTQKAELEKMKAEGRQRFEKTHHARPPFQGIGNPIVKPGFKAPKVSE